MKRRLAIVMTGGVFAGATIVAASGVMAQDMAATHDNGIELDLKLGAAYAKGPDLHDFGVQVEAGNFDYIRNANKPERISEPGPSVALGLSVPLESFGVDGRWGQDRIRLDVDGSWFDSSFRQSMDLQSGEYLDTIPITGDASPGEIAASSGVVRTKGEFDYDVVFSSLSWERKFGKRDGAATFVRVGPAFGYSRQKWDVRHEPETGGFNRLSEKATAKYLGPMVGARIVKDISQDVSVHVGGELSALHAWGDFDGSQNASNFPEAVSVSDDDNSWGARLAIEGGVQFAQVGRARIGVDGFVSWQSNVPEIVNPQVGPGENGLDTRDPAYLDYDPAWSAGVRLSVNIPFG